ncbi:TPA: hypothetical protein TUF60_001972, partial [Streptococcus equi subsp. zooepidemicus]|nr:hypothetical protein [Streptococcus equi subsp. zooepidemicus]HEL0220021.1 hypothetical protein [Streptococcus equi subsp. zooepidemicus]HEL0222968.1 hypothetical protein [Streptococcus equi subsp. zooepidemicus]HEL0464242.1 hypothetical protein [Streptococcus equi subsp. zooepidemicus]HEL1210027.1 hypothetical protein [Streptococcus equi subsp. zooepidemicus]
MIWHHMSLNDFHALVRKKKWKLKALSATSYAGGFLVFLYEKNWLEAIIKIKTLPKIFWQDFWQEAKSIYQFL